MSATSPVPIRSAPASPFPDGPEPFPIPVVEGPRPVSHRWRNLAIAAIVVAAIVTISLLGIAALTTPFSLQVTAGGCVSRGTTFVFPPGSTVSFRWSAPSGSAVEVNVSDLSHVPVYTGAGDSGSNLFTSNGGPYSFNATACAPTVVSFSGEYTLGTGFL